MTPCKLVDSADSFYSANGKFYLRPDKYSFDLFDSTNGKYYARSDIVFSIRKLHLISNNDPLKVYRFGRFVRFSERIILFTTWQDPSDNCIFIIVMVTACIFVATSSMQWNWTPRINTEKSVCIPRSSSVSRELTVLCQYTEFQKQSVKINTEDKHWETCMYTSFFKSVSRELTVLCQYTEFPNQSVKINTRKGYVYTNVGRVALIF